MKIEEFINYLIKEGFNEKQINQLVKIQEAGYDLLEGYYDEYYCNVNIIKEKYVETNDNIEKLRELKDVLLKNKFSKGQLIEIMEGYKLNIEYSIYSDIKFNWSQMLEIKEGLIDNVNILKYCDESYENTQMEQIKIGLKDEVDVTKYCNKKYNEDQMRQIRLWLEHKIDITLFCNDAYTEDQMNEIGSGIEMCVDVRQYNDVKYNNNQMKILKSILVYNNKNSDKEIDIELFQNEKILSGEMYNLFFMLVSGNQNEKIEAYKKLNKYNEKNKINKINNNFER
jgi:hypothetical protein